MRKSYATDLSDSEWTYLRSHLSELPKTVRTRTHSLRDIFDAIFYVLKTGCHRRLLPHNFPPWQTVFYHFRRFRLGGMWYRILTILRAADYLDDAPEFDYWASLEREGWRTRLTVVLDSLSGLLLESGEAREAAAVAERWSAQDPHSEAAHGRLMRTRYALGDRAGALRVYEQYRSAAEGGAEEAATAPEMAALAARIGAERGDGGTLSRLPLDRRPRQAYGPRGSREAPGAPLVGRAEELGALAEEHSLVPSGGARAVALVGEAGIGKTRLAEEFLPWSAAEGADVLRGTAWGPARACRTGR